MKTQTNHTKSESNMFPSSALFMDANISYLAKRKTDAK